MVTFASYVKTALNGFFFNFMNIIIIQDNVIIR